MHHSALLFLSVIALAMPIVAFLGGRMPNLLGRRLRCEPWKGLQEKQSFWQAPLEHRLTNMQASAECPSNCTKLYQVDPLTLLLLQAVIAMLVIGTFFGLVFAALFIYVWTHSYPWLKMVGKFVARPLNFFSLGLLYVLLWVAFIAGLLIIFPQLTDSPGLLTYFLLLLVLALIPFLFILYFLLALGVVVWIVRLIKWLYAHWRGWLEGIYFSARLGLIRLKIKADTLQETGFRGKPGPGARAKPTAGFKAGKKDMGLRGKLEALKGEFSGDVQRARSKLSRRK